MSEASRKVRVLLADDEKHIRLLMKAVLMPLDCEVVGEAGNGEEAVSLYKELRPDVVLLDISMPVKNGIEALDEIIQYDEEATVVMLTSISDMETVDAALKIGAAHYVRKDTPPSELREILKGVWEGDPDDASGAS